MLLLSIAQNPTSQPIIVFGKLIFIIVKQRGIFCLLFYLQLTISFRKWRKFLNDIIGSQSLGSGQEKHTNQTT